MELNEGTFSAAEGLKLFYQEWLPDAPARGAVVIVHGFSDHCGRYDNLVAALVRRRFAAYSYDLRGHGRSPGQPGHIEHFDDYRQDTRLFIEHVVLKHPDLPMFLFGHSMGGLIALDQALKYPQPLNGVISSAAHLGNPPISAFKQAVGRILSRVWPSFSMEAGLDENGLSRDEESVRAYRDDPLVHGRGSVRLATELEAAVAETQAHAGELELPLMIYFGTDDRLTNPADSQRFYNNAGSKDKRIVIYEGGHHENHNDIHFERVVIEVAQWIEEHVLIASQKEGQKGSIDG